MRCCLQAGWSVAAIASGVVAPLFMVPGTAQAAAEYCHRIPSGAKVCIQTVFGPRSNRGMVFTSRGRVYTSRFNCYNYNYGSRSLRAVACWSYDGISSEPVDLPAIEPWPQEIKDLMSNGDFVPADQAVDLEKIKSVMPQEMQQ